LARESEAKMINNLYQQEDRIFEKISSEHEDLELDSAAY